MVRHAVSPIRDDLTRRKNASFGVLVVQKWSWSDLRTGPNFAGSSRDPRAEPEDVG